MDFHHQLQPFDMTKSEMTESETSKFEISKSDMTKSEISGPVVQQGEMSPAPADKHNVEDVAIGEDEEHEVFKTTTAGVQFRTVGWPMASIIFLKRELDRITKTAQQRG